MKLFLSWSGEPSQSVAQALHEWIPCVLQAVRPWMSATDIGAGQRWRAELGGELQETSFGVICLTPSNQAAPWLLFEAGALAKSMKESSVVPYCIGIDMTEISGPLAEFQGKTADKAGTWGLITSINDALGDRKVKPENLESIFDSMWPKLEAKLKDLPQPTAKKTRDMVEMVEEILLTVRGLSSKSENMMLFNLELLQGIDNRYESMSRFLSNKDRYKLPENQVRRSLREAKSSFLMKALSESPISQKD